MSITFCGYVHNYFSRSLMHEIPKKVLLSQKSNITAPSCAVHPKISEGRKNLFYGSGTRRMPFIPGQGPDDIQKIKASSEGKMPENNNCFFKHTGSAFSETAAAAP